MVSSQKISGNHSYYFRIRTSLGLKFCNSLSMYSALPCAVKNSPVETSKMKSYRFIGKENGS
jgi:hypothetical protein